MQPRRLAVAILVVGASATGAAAPRAEAFNPLKPVCTVGGLISGLVGKACSAVQHGGRLVAAGGKLASGHLGGAVKTVLGDTGSAVASKATFAVGLAAVVTWVLGGTKYALHETASIIGRTTAPQLDSTWFSATYWRVAGLAAILTLPFLFAAAIQALVQSDLALLARAALGYLPLAMLAVGIAAPLTMLLLAASDQLSAVVSSAAGNASGRFLSGATQSIGGLTLTAVSPFLVFFVGLLTVGAAIVLWFELLLRAAAVYVIVLMLPLAFAALVWPARRMWAIRTVEVLVALILSKFVIVAVLSLGGAALSASAFRSVTGMLAGFVLLGMGALAPWVLLRLLPLGELASGAVGSWRSELVTVGGRRLGAALGAGLAGHEWGATTAEMRRQAEEVSSAADVDRLPPSPPVEQTPREDTLVGGAVPPPEDAAKRGADAAKREAPAPGNGGPQGDSEDEPVPGRSPRLSSIWQTEDFSWPVTTLGFDGWPPRPIEDEIAAQPESDANGRASRAAADPSPVDTRHLERAGRLDAEAPPEDHDPTPPPQPPETGGL